MHTFDGMNLACWVPEMIFSAAMRCTNIAIWSLVSAILSAAPLILCGSEIHEAAKAGSVDVAKALIEATPALVNEASSGGITPLHLAAVYGQADMAAYLISKGAELEARMDAGFT
ncbi:MAG: ankyrin repeat domain-containing protein, partial [bacterium]